MKFWRFSLFTALGAGIWSMILAGIGFYLGALSQSMTYADLVHKGKNILRHNLIWILLGLAVIIVLYALSHHYIMKKGAAASGAKETVA